MYATLESPHCVWRYRDRKTFGRFNCDVPGVPNDEYGRSVFGPLHSEYVVFGMTSVNWGTDKVDFVDPTSFDTEFHRVHVVGPGKGTLIRRKNPKTRTLPSSLNFYKFY